MKSRASEYKLEESLQQPLSMDYDPPLQSAYNTLLNKTMKEDDQESFGNNHFEPLEEFDLPLVDLGLLELGEKEREDCQMKIAKASMEWGFFQVVNHGISREILAKIRREQVKLFKQPFQRKSREDKCLNIPAGSYRWGTPTAQCLRQLSWSEAFHIPMGDISAFEGFTPFSSAFEQYATRLSALAQGLAEILAEKIGHNSTFFEENCLPSTCYLRMNRYPPCPISSGVCGLMPHTDSDFLTILHQDQVGGLQLVKDGKWVAVKPNPEALIINIGDLLQVWSNNVYQSVEHRVVTNPQVERFSIAFFFCPSRDTVIKSCCEPSAYKVFSFREYKQQVEEDVKKLGSKVGLSRFLL